MTEDERACWDAMRAVYAGFTAGDPGAVDAQLHPDVTIWDSDEPALVRGLEQLAALRGRRPAVEAAGAPPSEEPARPTLEAVDPVVDVWGDVALLRHVLHVRSTDGSEQVVRNTSVWRRVEGRWLAVHNHEDVIGGL